MPEDTNDRDYPFNALWLKSWGRLDEANKIHQEWMRRNPTWPQPRFALACNYHGQGRTDEAMRLLRENLEIDPNHSISRYTLARWLLDAGQEQEALDEFLKVAMQNISEGRPQAECRAIGEILWRRGDHDSAIRWLEKLVREPGGCPSPHDYAALMQKYIDVRRYDDAIHVGRVLIAECPNYLPGYLLVEKVLASRGRYAEAKKVLQGLLRLVAEREKKGEFSLQDQAAMVADARHRLAQLEGSGGAGGEADNM